jgi:antitoxin CcdA
MAPARKPRKAATNVSLPPDLVARAKVLKINLSQVCQAALEREIKERERAAWLAENEEAFEGYNRWVAKHGLFSDQWRRF